MSVQRSSYRKCGMVLMLVIGMSRSIHAQPPAKLDTLKVTAQGSNRVLTGRDAFAERRMRGFGHFYDAAELQSRNVAHVSDLLQAEPNIAIIRPPTCTGPGRPGDPNVHHNNCATSASARIAVTRGFCAMKILLDGVPLTTGGEIDTRDERFDPRHNWMTAYDLSSLGLGSMEKIEVYRRSEEIPLEFKSFDTECGLIVLWTRQ